MLGNDYKIVDHYVITPITLGRGAFGIVKRGYEQKNPEVIVAVKVMSIDLVNQNKNQVKLLKRELDILPKVENPYIVKLYHASRTKNNFYMFLEFCNGGDLKELLKKRGGKLSEAEALTYFRHIVEGFKGIYQENVIHRDIKPANILLHEGRAKISDFGFARVVTDMEQVDHFTLLGTPLYMSPQILKGEKFSAKCDIWSLGMLFYELLYGVTAWNASNQPSLAKMIDTKPLSFPDQPKRSQLVKDTISKMLQVEEENRISWYELFESDVVKFDETKIIKEFQQIASEEQDPLDKQAKLSQLYLDHNRVVDQNHNAQIQNFFYENKQQDSDSEIQSQGEQNSALNSQPSDQNIQPNLKYNQIVEAQNELIDKNLVIQNIDSYLTFNRNVGIFVNFTTNSIFKLFKDGLIKLPNQLFYRTIFSLQKYQMIQFQNLIDIMASKVQIGQGFSVNDWKSYKKSKEYFSTLHSIKSDTAYIKPYFNEIFQRTTDFLAQNKTNFSATETAQIKNFTAILNKEFTKDSLTFFVEYENTINDVLQRLIVAIQSDANIKSDRLALQTAKYLKICLDPFKIFKWIDYQPMAIGDNEDQKKEFNQFYEYYEQIDLNKLRLEVQEDLIEYQSK